MEYKIGIIASDIEMKRSLEDLYPGETSSGQFMIEVLDNAVLSEQGRRLEQAGAELIIGRSGGYSRTVGNVSVPVLKLKVTTSDVMNAIIKAQQDHSEIALFLWDQINVDTRLINLCNEHLSMHTFEDGDAIESLFEQTINDGFQGVVVGGGVVCSLARKRGIPYVFISPSNESIKDLINYAEQVLTSVHEVKYKNELLTTVVHGIHDAVVAIDEHHEIMLFNKPAQDILKLSPENAIGRRLLDVLPELTFLILQLENKIEHSDELIQFREMVLTYNTSLIRVDDQVKGVLFSFQDITKLQRLEQKIRLEMNRKGLVAKYSFDDIVSVDPVMETVIEKARKIAPSNSTAILYGESGTGKEIIASSLHNMSNRKKAPFVAVNCAALTETLLESELFGYEEGAFTGARKGGKPGLFELAHGGTIFLDEINSVSSTLQAKLLRVIEEKEVMRIGSDYVIPLDVRIISAANEDLYELVKKDRFRKDLFYRLNSLELHLPPLRERVKDVYPLFEHFLREALPDKDIRWPDEIEKKQLEEYSWPGNIRELKNVCERYVLFDALELSEQMIDEIDTPAELEHYNIDLKDIHQLVEDRIIKQLLDTGMNKTQVADVLGISRTALWKKTNK